MQPQDFYLESVKVNGGRLENLGYVCRKDLHIGATACECSYLQLGPKAALTKAQFGQLPNYNYLLRNNDKMLSEFGRNSRQDQSVYILVLQNICLY